VDFLKGGLKGGFSKRYWFWLHLFLKGGLKGGFSKRWIGL